MGTEEDEEGPILTSFLQYNTILECSPEFARLNTISQAPGG